MPSNGAWLLAVCAGAVARLGAAVAAFTAGGWAAGWTFASYREWNAGLLPLMLPAQLPTAGRLAWTVIGRGERILLRHTALALAVSLVPFHGWYFLLLRGEGGGWLAAADITYGVGGVLAGSASLLSMSGGRSSRYRTPRVPGGWCGSRRGGVRGGRRRGLPWRACGRG